ncbi:MAG TPA: helix-turn-helix domain-containing protein [Rhodospirillales bacterium]|jgi:AraC-like DNA-binding protein/mannose-6-phosphate isomerase-like protein (cupin superfamily)
MPKRNWEPSKSTVEKSPNRLQVSHEQPGVMAQPHWHAQFEVNFVIRGTVDYRMHGHSIRLERGSIALFWGGLPHQVVDTSSDPEYIAFHLPLVHFFRLRLPYSIHHRIIHGATLLSLSPDEGDFFAFDRWSQYMRSGDEPRIEHAIDELLLRLERIPLESFGLIDPAGELARAEATAAPGAFVRVKSICDYITENFRHDISAADIAIHANIHPKYAMSIFRQSTGMTLNEYVSLLRLSYAQAMLINDDAANVLSIAMDSGFGSLSAFNKSFRKVTGRSPSDFRRDYVPRLRRDRKIDPVALAATDFNRPEGSRH